MEFFKKLFGDNASQEKKTALNPLLKELEGLVKPIVRTATQIHVEATTAAAENTQLHSHFGGQPYFEQGEDWPKTKSGEPLDFIFQIFNQPEFELPESIQLVQFFYDWEESPWNSDNDGWLVKIYKTLHQEQAIQHSRPEALRTAKYCKMKFAKVSSLPDWEGIDTYSSEVEALSCRLNEEEPWEAYAEVVTHLIGEPDYRSQLGGYPRWVQGGETPKGVGGQPMKLLFQIDSEHEAGLMWGDVGLIYVFYDEQDGKVEFILQCH